MDVTSNEQQHANYLENNELLCALSFLCARGVKPKQSIRAGNCMSRGKYSIPRHRRHINQQITNWSPPGICIIFIPPGINLLGTCFKFSLNARKSPCATLVKSFLLACRAAHEFLSLSSPTFATPRAQGIQISS
jgi:hypothetical protein